METLCYRRVSTLYQVNASGDSLADQLAKVSAWCSYQGLPEPTDYCDAGISGYSTDNRPQFMAAMRHALTLGPQAVLVVTKIDRLGRNALDVQESYTASWRPALGLCLWGTD